jgi:hypothetical protein
LELLCVHHRLLREQQQLVIDRKRIFLFRPKTNIRQEKAAEYSADNENSAQGSKHRKNVNLYKEKNGFLGWQLQVAVDGHDLYATETYIHKTLTMTTKSLLSREKIACEMKSYYIQDFFVFGSTCRILVLAEYSADNFRLSIRPKKFSVDH